VQPVDNFPGIGIALPSGATSSVALAESSQSTRTANSSQATFSAQSTVPRETFTRSLPEVHTPPCPFVSYESLMTTRPCAVPHSIQAFDDGLEILLLFSDGNFDASGTTFHASDWLVHTPLEILAQNFQVDPSVFGKLPAKFPYVFYPTVPPPQYGQGPKAPNDVSALSLSTLRWAGADVHSLCSPKAPSTTTSSASATRLRLSHPAAADTQSCRPRRPTSRRRRYSRASS
jgi:hypothetical protein